MTRRELNWWARRRAGFVLAGYFAGAIVVYGFLAWGVFHLIELGMVP